MNQNKLFLRTRWRLAGLYAGVMGAILGLCGLGGYQALTYDRWQALNHRLESVAGTLRDGLEPALQHPGAVTPLAEHYLPDLCLSHTDCAEPVISGQHIAGTVQQNGYYIRFLNPAGQLIATAGLQPMELPLQPLSAPESSMQRQSAPGQTVQWQSVQWQTLQTMNGTHYRQLSLLLKTQNQQPWGYMQVGQSLQEYDDYLVWLCWVLVLGLPSAMLLVSAASWWLAGLAMQPIYQSYQQIQQFTADAAHELRTPIAAMQSSIESSLQDKHLSATEARNTLQVLERQNHRLSRLVQDLLLLSRMDLKGVSFNLQPCCLNEVMGDLLEGFSPVAIDRDLSLILDWQVQYPLCVMGNEEQLYRLIANLVMNAMQYTPEGGKIILRLMQEENQAIVQVQDTGIGMALKEQLHIFERFYRISSDRSRTTGGSGLGLAIARAIAQAHQGSLQVQSELGQGSIFTLRLPLVMGNG